MTVHKGETEIYIEEKDGKVLTKKIALKANFDKKNLMNYS
jgi:hypothetical protein